MYTTQLPKRFRSKATSPGPSAWLDLWDSLQPHHAGFLAPGCNYYQLTWRRNRSRVWLSKYFSKRVAPVASESWNANCDSLLCVGGTQAKMPNQRFDCDRNLPLRQDHHTVRFLYVPNTWHFGNLDSHLIKNWQMPCWADHSRCSSRTCMYLIWWGRQLSV